MKAFGRKLALLFFAGAVGALVNSLLAWAFGELGVTRLLGVTIAPDLAKEWIYPRIVWGGLWGFLFFVPLWRRYPALRGVVFSLVPTAVQLLVIFPDAGKGLFGHHLGLLTPVVVFLLNAVWGMTAAFWLRMTGER